MLNKILHQLKANNETIMCELITTCESNEVQFTGVLKKTTIELYYTEKHCIMHDVCQMSGNNNSLIISEQENVNSVLEIELTNY